MRSIAWGPSVLLSIHIDSVGDAQRTGILMCVAKGRKAWADRLALRDQERDDRCACIECKHLSGTSCRGGEAYIPNLLIRCKRFAFEIPK